MSVVDGYEIQQCIEIDTFKAIDKESKKEVIIKFFDYDESEQNLYFKKLFFIDHPIKGLINLINGRRGLSDDPHPYFQYSIPINKDETELKNFDGTYFVTPFMKNGTDNEKMNPTIRSKIIFGVASTLKRLENLHFFSVGLSLNKIFLDDNLEPILKFPIHKRILNHPSFFYSPEELLCEQDDDCNESGFQSDVFSFAIVIYFMFSEYFIGSNGKPEKSIFNICNGFKKGLRFKKPENMPEPYWNLVEKCWEQNPNERPTFSEITEILKNDQFAIEEFGMKTDLDELHRFQNQAESLN